MSKEKKPSLEEKIQAETTAYVQRCVASAPDLQQWQRDRLSVVLHPEVIARRPVKRDAA